MSRDRPSGAGRFAPSPTGPLHLGSLLAATASYLDARAQGLAWRVRLDDLDRARNQPGAEREILTALESHGLGWDGPVVRQSEHQGRYRAALDRLAADGRLFYCRCSRSRLAGHRTYPGTCRAHTRPRRDSAARVRVEQTVVEFQDEIQGVQRHDLARETGDFVVLRRDGIVAYQLATAVDDGDPGIIRVVRGRDLLENTPRQVFLMQCLDLPVPVYAHVPLLVNAAGQKLSKQTHAPPLDLSRPRENLRRVLSVLGLAALAEDPPGSCEPLLAEAARRFSVAAVPRGDTTVTEFDRPGASGHRE